RRFERARDLVAIEPEDENVNGFFGLLDGRDYRRDARVGLKDEFHTSDPASQPEHEMRSKLLASSGCTASSAGSLVKIVGVKIDIDAAQAEHLLGANRRDAILILEHTVHDQKRL